MEVKEFISSTKSGEYFNKSRNTDDYRIYQPYFSTVVDGPDKSEVTGIGTNALSFKASLQGKLESTTLFNLREDQTPDPCPGCSDNVVGLRYYYPILFEIELDGFLEVHHFDKATGSNIDSLFPDQSKSMIKGNSYTTVPATNAQYQYSGYKESKAQPSERRQRSIRESAFDNL